MEVVQSIKIKTAFSMKIFDLHHNLDMHVVTTCVYSAQWGLYNLDSQPLPLPSLTVDKQVLHCLIWMYYIMWYTQ